MRPTARLTILAIALSAALGSGAAVGRAVGPIGPLAAMTAGMMTAPGAHVPGAHGPGAHSQPGAAKPAALVPVAPQQDGYVLEPETTHLEPADEMPFAFRITGPDGSAVEEPPELHGRGLHLIVVSHDLSSFAHVHPEMEDGTWSAKLPSLVGGTYRAYAEFVAAGGAPMTLGVDLMVHGETGPVPLPETTTATSVDGYDIRLSQTPVTETTSELAIAVSANGKPVTELEPYLESLGHLIVVRASDLGFVHAHALEPEGDDAAMRFLVDLPPNDDYQLFLEFAHNEDVHRTAFTMRQPTSPPPHPVVPPPPDEPPPVESTPPADPPLEGEPGYLPEQATDDSGTLL